MLKLGLQGITILQASGDSGVTFSPVCAGDDQKRFSPNYMAGCPYITVVCGSALPKGGKPGDAEVAAYLFGSGGGFSNIHTTPDWQKTHVVNPHYPSYNTTDNIISANTTDLFNRQGRAFPDIAAYGQNSNIVLKGKLQYYGGASMSTPVAASVVNRINEALLATGKSRVGYINPALYKAPADIFHDVTVGDMSDHDKTPGAKCGTGKRFTCAEGWDPVTGLGTPKYDKWLAYFQGLR